MSEMTQHHCTSHDGSCSQCPSSEGSLLLIVISQMLLFAGGGQTLPNTCFCKCSWNTAMPFVHLLSVSAFLFQWRNGVVVTETVWPAEPKVFTIWPLTGNVCGPYLMW